MDCLRVAKRLGAPTVRCVYRRSEAEAPARIEEIRHAKEEGIEFFFLHWPVEIIVDDDGDVRGMKVQKMELGEPDERGRRKPVPTGRIRRSGMRHGHLRAWHQRQSDHRPIDAGASLNKWGYIVADESDPGDQPARRLRRRRYRDRRRHGHPGDGRRRRAAKAIAAYLQSGKTHLAGRPPADVEALRPALARRARRRGGAGFCPKCHQPLDGDESYICCADAQLQWRCDDCAKVSEGFAFPYGMCPHCGGKLGRSTAPASAASLA